MDCIQCLNLLDWITMPHHLKLTRLKHQPFGLHFNSHLKNFFSQDFPVNFSSNGIMGWLGQFGWFEFQTTSTKLILCPINLIFSAPCCSCWSIFFHSDMVINRGSTPTLAPGSRLLASHSPIDWVPK